MLTGRKRTFRQEFEIGEGLVGQCAFEKERILLTNVPQGLCENQLRVGKGKTRQSDHPSVLYLKIM